MCLLSKIPSDWTVGFLRAEKENCSTRRGQRVDTSCLGWFEALNGSLIGFKNWNRNVKIVGIFGDC